MEYLCVEPIGLSRVQREVIQQAYDLTKLPDIISDASFHGRE